MRVEVVNITPAPQSPLSHLPLPAPAGSPHPPGPLRNSGACFGALILELDHQMIVQVREWTCPKSQGKWYLQK